VSRRLRGCFWATKGRKGTANAARACLRALLLLGLDGRRVCGLQLRLRAPRGTLSASARARGTGWAVLRWGGGVVAANGSAPTHVLRRRRLLVGQLRARGAHGCGASAQATAAPGGVSCARKGAARARALASSRACVRWFQKMDGRRCTGVASVNARVAARTSACWFGVRDASTADTWRRSGARRASAGVQRRCSGRARARVPSPSSAYVKGPPPLATQAAACAPAAARCPRPEMRGGPHDTWRRVAPRASCGAGVGRAVAQHNTRTGAAASPRAAPPIRAACAPRHASAAVHPRAAQARCRRSASAQRERRARKPLPPTTQQAPPS
jgi:hypothetical protein